jgi:hypothetical protein
MQFERIAHNPAADSFHTVSLISAQRYFFSAACCVA